MTTLSPSHPGTGPAAAPSPHETQRYPCTACGGALAYAPGTDTLECPHCGAVQTLAAPVGTVDEQDLRAQLAAQATSKAQGVQETVLDKEVTCQDCGATVAFQDGTIGTDCAYCGSPVQRTDVHAAEARVPIDGILPFQVDEKAAAANLKAWVNSRWFAPNALKTRGAHGKFSGVYLPFWTYDAHADCRYTGERGDDETYEVQDGEDTRTETRTEWTYVSGTFERGFDDITVCGTKRLPAAMMAKLEPWPTEKMRPYEPAVMAGYQAQTYDIDLAAGFDSAEATMQAALRTEATRRIGGDRQRLHDLDVHLSDLSYKHLMLPVWLMAYRYQQKTYQVAINAATGEVQGERPYSAVKIAFAVLGAIVFLGLLWAVFGGSHGR